MKKLLDVVELFAGVGGFRLGLEGWQGKSASSNYKKNKKSMYKVVWSNQWEPSILTQYASIIYEERWGKENHSNINIEEIDINQIPPFDLLTAGFPCQDYSVANLLKSAKGLIGKKGVLFWSIYNILNNVRNKPKYLLLENVDRLLTSPKKAKGRDFAIILQSLNNLGYAIEWRIINAAEYGMPQKRKRIFILGYHQSSPIYKRLKKSAPEEWMLTKGILADAFPVKNEQDSNHKVVKFNLEGTLDEITKNFNYNGKKSVFLNSGWMIDSKVISLKTTSNFHGKIKTLGSILYRGKISDKFYIQDTDIKKWKILKGAKKKERKLTANYSYTWSEGTMSFPDDLKKPSRTIITRDGGSLPSRTKHAIQTSQGLRVLLPIEVERLNMFPDNHTYNIDMLDSKRVYLMGNALVVGVVEKIGDSLYKFISSDKKG